MTRLREVVSLGTKLRHPRLVATYALEIEDQMAAVVMGHVSEQTLKGCVSTAARTVFKMSEHEMINGKDCMLSNKMRTCFGTSVNRRRLDQIVSEKRMDAFFADRRGP